MRENSVVRSWRRQYRAVRFSEREKIALYASQRETIAGQSCSTLYVSATGDDRPGTALVWQQSVLTFPEGTEREAARREKGGRQGEQSMRSCQWEWDIHALSGPSRLFVLFTTLTARVGLIMCALPSRSC